MFLSLKQGAIITREILERQGYQHFQNRTGEYMFRETSSWCMVYKLRVGTHYDEYRFYQCRDPPFITGNESEGEANGLWKRCDDDLMESDP